MTPRVERALGLERPLPLVRAVIGAEIDRLIAMLDAMDGNHDMEDGGDDEPTLGGAPVYRADKLHHDLEEEDEHGGDVLDEPHDDDFDGEDDCRDRSMDWLNDHPEIPQEGALWRNRGEVAVRYVQAYGDTWAIAVPVQP